MTHSKKRYAGSLACPMMQGKSKGQMVREEMGYEHDGRQRNPQRNAAALWNHRMVAPTPSDILSYKRFGVNTMPKEKTHSMHSLQLPFTARELAQVRFHFNPGTKDHPNCICTAQAVLAQSRGNPMPCSEFPWKCPFPGADSTNPSV